MSLLPGLDEAVPPHRSRTALRPKIGLVLGSGLGAFAKTLGDATAIPFGEIPHFPVSTAIGHKGELVIGHRAGVPVAVMAGRVHYYEGYTPAEVVFPVRVLGRLGVATLVLTNAAGTVNPDFRPGELMVIEDHINYMGMNPLVGPNDDELGLRFFDMSEAYDPELRRSPRRREGRGSHRPEGRLRRLHRPVLRDARRDPHGPHAGRGRRRHVHRPRGHRGPAHGDPGARPLVHHEHGGGRHQAEAQPPRGARGGRAGQGGPARRAHAHREGRGAHRHEGSARSHPRPSSGSSPAWPARRDARPRSFLALQGRRRPAHAVGRDRHRVQHRERVVRSHPVRGAGGGVQGGLGGHEAFRRGSGRGRLQAPDPALRPLPPDPVGVLRRHRRCTWKTCRGRRRPCASPSSFPSPSTLGISDRSSRGDSRTTDEPSARLPLVEAPHRVPQPEKPTLDPLATREGRAPSPRRRPPGPRGDPRQAGAVARAAPLVANSLAAGGHLVFVGAGTSGRLGVLEAAECPPTFGTSARTIRAVIAGGQDAVFRVAKGPRTATTTGGARADVCGEGRGHRHLRELGHALRAGGPRDRAATRRPHRARDLRAAPRLSASPRRHRHPTGPEVLTGSTRLKAGSATKAVLNAITTTAMIRSARPTRTSWWTWSPPRSSRTGPGVSWPWPRA